MTFDLVELLKEETGKCINCGFCETVCPTLEPSGYDLWKGARGRVMEAKELVKAVESGSEPLRAGDSFYSCLDCHACFYICPAGVNAGIASHLSREIITTQHIKKNENPTAAMMTSVTMKYNNPLGIMKKCASWSEGMEFDRDSTDLLFTGNMYQLMSYEKGMNSLRGMMGKSLTLRISSMVSKHPSLIKLSPKPKDKELDKKMSSSLKNIVHILNMSGIRLNYLRENEPYPGTFLYDLGYIEEFKEYAKRVSDIFHKANAKRIITVDPHSYDLLKNVYPLYVENFDFSVTHYLDLIDVPLLFKERNITLHEPCHFSMRSPEYTAEIKILRSTANLVMPERSGKKSRCCGGPDELLFPEISEKVSQERYAELEKTGASQIVTACPICFSNLAKSEKVTDISDFILQSVLL